MLRAEKEGITPEALIGRVWHEHKRDFAAFGVDFDNYYSTIRPRTGSCARKSTMRLKDAGPDRGALDRAVLRSGQGLFLPDRFIKGECPKCGAKDQYGDNCEVCGATYSPTELKNPVRRCRAPSRCTRIPSITSSSSPTRDCEAFLREWTKSGALQDEAANKMQEWFARRRELSDWDISRDAPYFGFEIPDAPGKYFYVWLDAPVGYMAASPSMRQGTTASTSTPGARNRHRTGALHRQGHPVLPRAVLAGDAAFSGHRTADRGVRARLFDRERAEDVEVARHLHHRRELPRAGLNPEWLRYYYAAKLNGSMEDIDLNLDDFVARVNSDLVGKFINIASRTAGFIHKNFDGKLADGVANLELIGDFQAAAGTIAAHYEARDYSKALREIMALADRANQYVADEKPWELAKKPEAVYRLHEVCTVALNCFRLLTLYLKPVLPKLAEEVEAFLNIPPLAWEDSQSLFIRHRINAYNHLMTRIDPKAIEAMVDANKQNLEPTPAPAPVRHAEAQVHAAQPVAARPYPKRSASTTSPRSTCASRASPMPSTSRAPTSCCG
jgi:methionyl-tRNA synthetase